jgi:putative hydrolase of the HAD superfamily
MIKTVIFDLGGVIVPFDYKRGYARLEPLCGYPAAQIPARLRETDLVTRLETGRIEPLRFVEELSGVLEISIGYREFCDIWTSIFLPQTLIPESFLEQLRERYRLLLLSNTNAIHYTMIRETYPLLRHFDHHVLSFEVGEMKPSPRIYQEALSHARCSPEECFFTDDIPLYVEGARREGIDAVQFQSFDQLAADMRQRGIF